MVSVLPIAFSVASPVLPQCTLEKPSTVQSDLELGIGWEDTCSHVKWRLSRKVVVRGEDCSKLCGSPDIQKLMLSSLQTRYFCKQALGNVFVLRQVHFIY